MKAKYFLVKMAVVFSAVSSVAVAAPVATLQGGAGFSKDRYVSFNPSTNGSLVIAIRVKRVGGIEKFVDCTQVVNKGANGFYGKLIDGPLPPPGDSTYYCDWSLVTTGLHVTGCNVVPGNTYLIDVTLDGDNYSSSISIDTTPPPAGGREFGDVVGPLVGGVWTAPDGLLTSGDIIAITQALNMDPTAPIIARVDIAGQVPDAVINMADLDRLSSSSFGYGVTGCLTGTCVPPVNCASLSFDCQQSADTVATPSDRQHSNRAADDFIPLASTISRIGWTGVWGGTQGGVNCNDNPPDDVWYLTIYEDDGNGLPWLVFDIPETPIFHDGRQIVNLQPGFKPTTYTAPVNISGLTVGGCYWLEISGEGSGDLFGSEACVWNWLHTDTSGSGQASQSPSLDGNGWSVQIPASHPAPYLDSSLQKSDYARCIDSEIAKNTVGNEGVDGGCGDRTGAFACCYRDVNNDPVCTSAVTLFECILGPPDNGLSGTVFTGKLCSDAGGPFACEPPVNDDCLTGANVIDQSSCVSTTSIGSCAKNKASWCSPLFAECANGDGLCIPILDDNFVESIEQFDCGILPTDNRFSTTDGPPFMSNPNVMDDCSSSDFGEGSFRADIWYKVVSPCDGLMSASMCGGGVYDAMMAAYTDCPAGNDPSAPTLIECNDDSCGSFQTVSELTPFEVTANQEVTIRVGGWGADAPPIGFPIPEGSQGQSDLHVRFACICPEFGILAPELLPGEAGYTMDRYISFDPSTNGNVQVAIRVTRVGGVEKFVDCTSLEDKGADGFLAELINGPLPSPGNATYYCDWSGVSQLFVKGCNVIPGNTYDVAMTIDGLAFSGPPANEVNCFGELTEFAIRTTTPQFAAGREFGDLVGSFVAGVWTAPEGLVTSGEIVAAVKKFQLDPTAPLLARLDTDGAVPDGILAANDILRIVLGFAGSEFGYGVTDCLTGMCVPPQGGACE